MVKYTPKEKEIIRDLGKKLADIAALPIQEKRRKAYYAHNDLKSTDPIINCSPEGGWREVITPDSLLCENEEARRMEWILRARIYRGEVVNDDIPVEARWDCQKDIKRSAWKLGDEATHNAFTNEGVYVPTISEVNEFWSHSFNFDETAGHFEPIVTDLEDEDMLSKIVRPQVIYNEERSKQLWEMHQDILGGILDLHWTGNAFYTFSMIREYTLIRGYDDMLFDIIDYPDEMKHLMQIIADGSMEYYKDLQKMGLLEQNISCQYVGTGGFAYTNDIAPVADGAEVSFKDCWANAESQEFVVVGPDETREFALPFEKQVLDNFGLSSYGCCDNLEDKLPDIKKYITNLRRISVSPWADVKSMADQVGTDYVFAMKPQPSYITAGWDEDFQMEYMTERVSQAKGTCLEIILKDTHTLGGDPSKLRKWTDLCRKVIDKVYG